MKDTKPNIIDYTNYRKFLIDFYNFKNKKMNNRFSFRNFSKEAGFLSPNYINLIIQNKKNLSISSIHQLGAAMKLNRREMDFFEALVFFNQATTESEKNRYFNKMLSFKEFRDAKKINKEQYEYFSKWYYVVVREMFLIKDFKLDPAWIAKRIQPKISEKEASESLELLKKIGYIVQDARKKWVVAEPHLTMEPEVASAYATQFHNSMIKQASEALNQPASLRDISSITMAVDEAQFLEIKRKIIRFRDSIQRYLALNPTPADRVCQLNYQLFHLVNKQNDEE